MAAAATTVCCSAPQRQQQRAGTSVNPKPRQVAARALSFPVQPTLGSSSTYTAGSQQLEAASCPWPKPPTWSEASSQPGGGVWAWLSPNKDEVQRKEAELPPEVERLARFADGPYAEPAAEQPQGLLSFWRYQGLGL